MGEHIWVRSTLGHGDQMCSRCKITNREAAALGELNVCYSETETETNATIATLTAERDQWKSISTASASSSQAVADRNIALTAALEEVRGALEKAHEFVSHRRDNIQADPNGHPLNVADCDVQIYSINGALATINAALGRVEG